MPSTEWVDEYIASVEEYVVSSFTFVSDINAINDSVNRLWGQVSRFGPPEIPDLNLRGLGRFEVPPPPPPPPLPLAAPGWYEEIGHWASRNKTLVGSVCVGAVGAGLLAGYSVSSYRKARIRTRNAQKALGSSLSNRRLLVVVLGGDTPLGSPLIAGLEREGYIVITSVSDPDCIAEIEANGNGFVRALVFDPKESSTLQPFLRSLKATLSLRFPLNTAGDPYQHSSASFPILFSVVSLLTLPPPSIIPAPAPFESLDLSSTYGQYLTQSHIMPLQAIQALLPLFRVDSIRSKDASHFFGGQKSIIFCVPAVDSRVGVPYASAQAMGAAATVRGAEVLRRELKQVADPHMRDIRIVIADVGSVGKVEAAFAGTDIQALENSVHSWTAGEQRVYGLPYTAFLSTVSRRTRPPSRVDTFVGSIVRAVGKNALKGEQVSTLAVNVRLWTFRLIRHIRGSRICVGAGAVAYTLASYLPSSVLDTLLNLPAHMGYIEYGMEPASGPLESANTDDAAAGEASELTEQASEELTAAMPDSAPKALDTSDANLSTNESATLSKPAGIETSWISVQD